MISTESPTETLDTSNFRKHTHANPVQKKLIDRFHHVVVGKIAELAPESFLDAGCGEGFVSGYLLDRMPGLEILGFDWNPDSVRMAVERNPAGSYMVADITQLPFDDKQFDVAGCFEVLEHLYDPEKALGELLRVSRQAIVLSVPHEPWFCMANVARGKNLDITPKGSDPDHRQFWNRSAFQAFVSAQAEIRWLGGSFPWTICVAAPRR
ncbi:MAG: methyltransferase domain-containing protein [Thermomicrobiales bacterium]|nr:methyltransferase domain-containing protein [Thermomicrobiales bacterium]